jgi:hypothetical protein
MLELDQVGNCGSWAILARNFSAKLGAVRVSLRFSSPVTKKREVLRDLSREKKLEFQERIHN